MEILIHCERQCVIASEERAKQSPNLPYSVSGLPSPVSGARRNPSAAGEKPSRQATASRSLNRSHPPTSSREQYRGAFRQVASSGVQSGPTTSTSSSAVRSSLFHIAGSKRQVQPMPEPSSSGVSFSEQVALPRLELLLSAHRRTGRRRPGRGADGLPAGRLAAGLQRGRSLARREDDPGRQPRHGADDRARAGPVGRGLHPSRRQIRRSS